MTAPNEIVDRALVTRQRLEVVVCRVWFLARGAFCSLCAFLSDGSADGGGHWRKERSAGAELATATSLLTVNLDVARAASVPGAAAPARAPSALDPPARKEHAHAYSRPSPLAARFSPLRRSPARSSPRRPLRCSIRPILQAPTPPACPACLPASTLERSKRRQCTRRRSGEGPLRDAQPAPRLGPTLSLAAPERRTATSCARHPRQRAVCGHSASCPPGYAFGNGLWRVLVLSPRSHRSARPHLFL